MKTYATITLEVPLDDIDFSDCGDGCGTIDGLSQATYKGAMIAHFHSDDVDAATDKMMRDLGEKTELLKGWYERAQASHDAAVAAEREAMVQAIRNEVLGDPISMNKRNW